MTCNSGDEDPDALTEIGHARLDEFGETGDERVLAAAVAAYERALEVLPPGEEQWTFLSNLGNALREVYEASWYRTALDRAGDLLERALHGLSSEDADRAVVLDNLALVLRERYGDLGYLDELRKAAELHEDALAAYGDGPERALPQQPRRSALGAVRGDRRCRAPGAGLVCFRGGRRRRPGPVTGTPACTCRTSPAPSSAPTGTRAERRCSSRT